MLKDLIKENTIQIIDSCKNWKDAIYIVAQPLIENGYIKETYKDEVIKNIERNGAYIVLKEGFALPHARPSSSVNNIGMSLLLTKEKVYFSNKEDKWANIIVMLSPTDNNSHLNALSELVTVISDDNKFNKLQNASSEEEILNIL